MSHAAGTTAWHVCLCLRCLRDEAATWRLQHCSVKQGPATQRRNHRLAAVRACSDGSSRGRGIVWHGSEPSRLISSSAADGWWLVLGVADVAWTIMATAHARHVGCTDYSFDQGIGLCLAVAVQPGTDWPVHKTQLAASECEQDFTSRPQRAMHPLVLERSHS